MKSGVVGMLGVFCLIVPAVWLGGGDVFFNVPGLFICILMPIALSWASAGGPDLGRALRSLRCLFAEPEERDVTQRNSQVLRHMITYAYAAGAIGALIGWIQALGHFEGPSPIPFWISLGLLMFFYSAVISECILRPAARRIEGELKRGIEWDSERRFEAELKRRLESRSGRADLEPEYLTDTALHAAFDHAGDGRPSCRRLEDR